MPFHYPDDSAESAPAAAGPLKPYDVVIRGTHTTLLLNDEDAKREGLLTDEPAEEAPVPTDPEPTPEPIAEPEPEVVETPAEPVEKVAPPAPNKARFNLLNKKG